MATLIKPPDTPLPSELLQEAGRMFGQQSRDSPVSELLDFFAVIHRSIWEW